MIYLEASVKKTAEKAMAGTCFDGTMYEKAIAELTQRFGNPALISKSLINKFLAIPAVQDGKTSSLRLFVSKTVTVRLESIDGSVKKCVFMWTTPKICEMTAVDWKLDHLRDLDIEKPVEHGEIMRNFFYHLNIA